MPDKTDRPSWAAVPLAWERASGALVVSRQRGWTWKGLPPGATAPDQLVGHRITEAYQDVVSIDLTDDRMPAIGARFALGDWGKPGAPGARPGRRPAGRGPEGSPGMAGGRATAGHRGTAALVSGKSGY